MARTNLARIIILLSSLVICCSSNSGAVRKAIRTDVCSIVANPKTYDGRRVVIDACVASDEYEYVFLFDEHTTCRGPGLTPLEGKQVTVTLTRNMCGEFMGTFYYDEKPTILSQTHKLYIDAVANLRPLRH